MPISGIAYVADGNPVQLGVSVVQGGYKSFDFKANSANGASFYIGGPNVQSDGTDAYVELEAGKSWGKVAEEGDQVFLNSDDLYVVGTASDVLHVVTER